MISQQPHQGNLWKKVVPLERQRKIFFQQRRTKEEAPDFLAQLDTENRDVKTELSELQVKHNDGDDDDFDNNFRCSTLRPSMSLRRRGIFCEFRFSFLRKA